MHRTVGELEATMSHRELIDWLRFEATASPLPDRLADIHAGRLSALIVNAANAVNGANREPVSTDDFVIIDRRAPPPAEDGRSEAERLQAIWLGG
jgi:hypothetical protein